MDTPSRSTRPGPRSQRLTACGCEISAPACVAVMLTELAGHLHICQHCRDAQRPLTPPSDKQLPSQATCMSTQVGFCKGLHPSDYQLVHTTGRICQALQACSLCAVHKAESGREAQPRGLTFRADSAPGGCPGVTGLLDPPRWGRANLSKAAAGSPLGCEARPACGTGNGGRGGAVAAPASWSTNSCSSWGAWPPASSRRMT